MHSEVAVRGGQQSAGTTLSSARILGDLQLGTAACGAVLVQHGGVCTSGQHNNSDQITAIVTSTWTSTDYLPQQLQACTCNP